MWRGAPGPPERAAEPLQVVAVAQDERHARAAVGIVHVRCLHPHYRRKPRVERARRKERLVAHPVARGVRMPAHRDGQRVHRFVALVPAEGGRQVIQPVDHRPRLRTRTVPHPALLRDGHVAVALHAGVKHRDRASRELRNVLGPHRHAPVRQHAQAERFRARDQRFLDEHRTMDPRQAGGHVHRFIGRCRLRRVRLAPACVTRIRHVAAHPSRTHAALQQFPRREGAAVFQPQPRHGALLPLPVTLHHGVVPHQLVGFAPVHRQCRKPGKRCGEHLLAHVDGEAGRGGRRRRHSPDPHRHEPTRRTLRGPPRVPRRPRRVYAPGGQASQERKQDGIKGQGAHNAIVAQVRAARAPPRCP